MRLAPLRERSSAIVPLARFFLQNYSRELNKPIPELAADACRALECYKWPGNIRELENVIHGALLLAPSEDAITAEQLRLRQNSAFP